MAQEAIDIQRHTSGKALQEPKKSSDDIVAKAASLDPAIGLRTEPQVSSLSTSLLTSPTIAESPTDDPIEAIDALEDALEEVHKILPNIEPVSPEKPARKPTRTASVKRGGPSNVGAKIGNKEIKPTATRTTTLSSTKITQSTALRKSGGAQVKPAAKTPSNAKATTATKRQSAILSSNDTTSSNTAPPTDYLASKRRPISIQFPPAPPPAKSSKPPTRPTFTLPGDAIAAKRRALLEEKLKKEQEELAKKREFKARPAPNSSKPRPTSMIVRQTTSSLARQSVAGTLDLNAIGKTEKVIGTCGTLKRAGTVTGVTSTTSAKDRFAAKRSSMIQAKPSETVAANTAQKRQSVTVSKPEPTKRSSIIIPKRQPILSNENQSASHRSVSDNRHTASSTVSGGPASAKPMKPEEAAALKQKARQIYNRDRVEKAVRDRERREKEDAAKRARAEAAEKGRQASREWAEKARKRAALAKQQGQQAQRHALAADANA
jgi:hypothetical protein